MTSIAELFAKKQAKLVAELFSPVNHGTTTGDTSEIGWRNLLQSFLPGRYRVATGFAVDHLGNVSLQNDIVIYDEQYSPLLWTNDHAIYIPIESVYAVLEVKQTLDLAAVTAASEKAEAVRTLTATSAPITHLTGKADIKQPITPLAGLLTQHCGWSPPFGNPFVEAMRHAGTAGQLDIGCALEGGTWVIPTDGDCETIEVVEAEHSLVFLSMQLFNLLQALGTVPRMAVPAWLEAGDVAASRLTPPGV
jgi:uncharacterized protein DUF6602